jgi:hypothetical protein
MFYGINPQLAAVLKAQGLPVPGAAPQLPQGSQDAPQAPFVPGAPPGLPTPSPPTSRGAPGPARP